MCRSTPDVRRRSPANDMRHEPDWFHATTLAERLSGWRPPEEAREDNNERAEYRLQAWKSQPPFDRPSYFEQRLSADHVTESDLRDLLAEPMDAVAKRLGSTPPWLIGVDAALASPATDRFPALLPEGLTGTPTAGFLTVAAPLVEQAVRRLEQAIAVLSAGALSLPFDPSTVPRLFARELTAALTEMLSRAMVLELNIARLEGTLEGATAEERFARFTASFTDKRRVRAFMREYPVLARLLAEQIDRWVDTTLELLGRLVNDAPTLQASFAGGGGLGTLISVSGALGDPHHGGRSVRILKFSSGTRIVYKPKSLAVDAHFQDLLQWLNARGASPAFKTMTVVDRGGYGWAEHAEARTCATRDELRRFYERQGAYVALLHVLDGTDFHAGNLIACGEYPVLVDLEALFHPLHRPGKDDGGADLAARRAIATSVLRIGLLPERVWANSESDGVDLSGMGTLDGQLTPHQVPRWEAAGTDSMHLVRRRKSVSADKNRPSLLGAPVNVLDYRQPILDGFAAMHALLIAHRHEWLSDTGPLARFRDDEVCVFLRSARTYRRLLRESYHPDLLHDALDRERHFDLLWIEIERHPELAAVLRTEREDLLRGDIPAMTTRPGSCHLWISAENVVADFFGEPSLAVVRRRLQTLGPGDLASQRWFIDASLSTLVLDGEESSTRRPVVQPHSEATHDRLLAAAMKCGDRLEASALGGESGASWIGLSLDHDRCWSIEPLGLDLYEGLPGVVLFLAYLGEATSSDRYTALARAALMTLRSQLKKRESSLAWIGAFDGWGGLLYVLTHVAVLWRDSGLADEARSIVARVPDLIEKDDVFDVYGGAAGCIAALRSLAQAAPSDHVTAAAVLCGDHLLAHASGTASGIAWSSIAANGSLKGCAGNSRNGAISSVPII